MKHEKHTPRNKKRNNAKCYDFTQGGQHRAYLLPLRACSGFVGKVLRWLRGLL